MASMLATVMLLGFFAVGSPLTMQRVEAAGIDMTNAFYITGNPADISQYTTVNANSISLGNTTGPYYNNVWQVVAATSKFKIDWTRSFSMVGFMVTPRASLLRLMTWLYERWLLWGWTLVPSISCTMTVLNLRH